MNPHDPAASPPLKLDANALAEDRTRLASERTLMAWVRTSVSLLGFGFTVYKFLEFEAAKDPVLGAEGPLVRALRGPLNFALTFIVLAIVSLAIAVVQHWQYTRHLDPIHGRKFDLTLVTAGFVAVIGVLSLMSLLFKIGPF